jgi:S-formylglutathione hydrolase FrmB
MMTSTTTRMVKQARLLLLLFALTCSIVSHAQTSTTTATAPAQREAARQSQESPRSERVRTIQLESKLVGKTLPYNVLLPVDYASPSAGAKRYPVLYLLHGLTGHYGNWLDHTRLAEYAAAYHFIIVMPEGNNGWYTDSSTVATDKYETYILRELIPDVAKQFRTVESREGRAVAGLSMGGYGALKFGVKQPELFAFAGSMSGAVSAASWRSEDELQIVPFIKQSLLQTFGSADHAVKTSNDLFKLVRELPPERLARLPFLYLDCGTEDPLHLLAPNRAFADLLVERKIPHEYRQLPGTHSWAYWDKQVREVLRITAQIFKSEPEAHAATK